jgi:tetratricopeptide (TPR) repeat protein
MLRSDTALRLEYRLRSVAAARAGGIANLPAWTLGNIGFTYFDLGRYTDSQTAFQEALDLMLALGDRKWRTTCQTGWSLAEFFMGNFARARELCEDGLRTAERFGLPHPKPIAMAVLALLNTVEQERLTAAQKWSDEAISLRASVWHGRLSARAARVVVTFAAGDYQTAWAEAPQRLKDSVRNGSLPYSITCLTVMAMLLADEGEHTRAAELLGLALNQPASPRGWFDHWPLLIRKLEQLEAELGADAFTAAWERGKAMDLKVVVEEVLAEYAV